MAMIAQGDQQDNDFSSAFYKGRKVGIRLVVEWIREVNKSGDFYYSFDQAELEAKLKEWGIK